MATLTSTGIDFGGSGGTLNSKYGIIPQTNSPMIFIQSSAPTGWTRVSQNNKALRVVSSSGGGTGGNLAFSSAFASRTFTANVPVTISPLSMGNRSLSVNTTAQHRHPINAGGAVNRNAPNPWQGTSNGRRPGTNTGNRGSGANHSHPAGYGNANGPGSVPIDMRVRYVDCNICSFD